MDLSPFHVMKRLRKLADLPSRDVLLLGTAWWLSLVTSRVLVVCGVGPSRKTVRLMAAGCPMPASPVPPERVAWAVEKAAGFTPGSTCLVSALVCQALLHRTGHQARLCIGAARNARGGVEAHAWIEDRGEVLLGGPASRVSGYTPFANVDEYIG